MKFSLEVTNAGVYLEGNLVSGPDALWIAIGADRLSLARRRLQNRSTPPGATDSNGVRAVRYTKHGNIDLSGDALLDFLMADQKVAL